jgi:hypothetical protein
MKRRNAGNIPAFCGVGYSVTDEASLILLPNKQEILMSKQTVAKFENETGKEFVAGTFLKKEIAKINKLKTHRNIKDELILKLKGRMEDFEKDDPNFVIPDWKTFRLNCDNCCDKGHGNFDYSWQDMKIHNGATFCELCYEKITS